MIVVWCWPACYPAKAENKTKEVKCEITEPKRKSNNKPEPIFRTIVKVFEAHGWNWRIEEQKEFVF